MSLRSSTDRIEDRRDEAVVEIAQALHELTGGRFDRDHLHVGLVFLQVAARAHQRSTRAEAGDEHVDVGAVAQDLGTGALVVRERVRRVAVLEEEDVAVGLVGVDLLRHADRAVAAFLAGRQRDLGPEDLEQLPPFDGDVLGHDHAQLVAAQLRNEREPDAGVARRRFEDRRARLDRAVAFGEVDHLQRDAVLGRTARVLAFELRPDLDVGVRRKLVHTDERRVSDQPEDVVVLHAPPATAGRIESTSPSASLVSRPSR